MKTVYDDDGWRLPDELWLHMEDSEISNLGLY